jgi:glucose/arabinose dehydrogenase
MRTVFRHVLAPLLLVATPLAAVDLRATVFLTDAAFTTDIVVAGDGSNRMYLARQDGVIRMVEGGRIRSEPFMDLRNVVGDNGDEQGLLSLAFAPNYAQRRTFYVYYTDEQGNSVLARYRASADGQRGDPASAQVVLAFDQPYPNHNGGKLQFGADGYLYLSTGDGGSGGDPGNRAQSRVTLLGKILRLDVESGAATYAIPPSNPYVGRTDAREEIWALGLRNPWRIAFDRATNELYIADVGQNSTEEVNIQAPGMGGNNYGWRAFEGNSCFTSACEGFVGHVPPVATYGHGLGCSITGGHVYRGTRYPGLVGTYLYGDYCSGRIFGLARAGNTYSATQLLDTEFAIVTFGVDELGEIYVADGNSGRIYALSDGPPVSGGLAIGAAFTGAWYDPAQDGHGLLIEVLPNNQMLVAWYTFRPEGGQAWVIGVGPITGDRAVIPMTIPAGGRFIPNFDPATITRPSWGQVTVRFSDCNNGTVDYQSTAGFGNGSMRLARITQIAGTACGG